MFIKNQFKFDCELKLDESGNPYILSNCKSKETKHDPWSVKEPTIRMSCFQTKTEDICRGKYTLQSFSGYSQDSEMTIAKRRE